MSDPNDLPMTALPDGNPEGHRTYRRIIFGIALLAVLAMIAGVWANFVRERPLIDVAQRYFSFPSHTVVVQFEHGPDPGEATAWFTTPKTGDSKEMDSIILMNAYSYRPVSGKKTNTSLRRVASDGTATFELLYEKSAKRYRIRRTYP